jgi:hypothetical protein
MESLSRKEIEDLLDHLLIVLNDTVNKIDKLDKKLKKKTTNKLLLKKEFAEEDLREIERDIVMYQEMLHNILNLEAVDERSSESCNETYDGHDEVLTGGDY